MDVQACPQGIQRVGKQRDFPLANLSATQTDWHPVHDLVRVAIKLSIQTGLRDQAVIGAPKYFCKTSTMLPRSRGYNAGSLVVIFVVAWVKERCFT